MENNEDRAIWILITKSFNRSCRLYSFFWHTEFIFNIHLKIECVLPKVFGYISLNIYLVDSPGLPYKIFSPGIFEHFWTIFGHRLLCSAEPFHIYLLNRINCRVLNFTAQTVDYNSFFHSKIFQFSIRECSAFISHQPRNRQIICEVIYLLVSPSLINKSISSLPSFFIWQINDE